MMIIDTHQPVASPTTLEVFRKALIGVARERGVELDELTSEAIPALQRRAAELCELQESRASEADACLAIAT